MYDDIDVSSDDKSANSPFCIILLIINYWLILRHFLFLFRLNLLFILFVTFYNLIYLAGWTLNSGLGLLQSHLQAKKTLQSRNVCF